MITDKNKNITSIKYNHLNLPTLISFGNGTSITYLYNAAGQKVNKLVNSVPVDNMIKSVDYLDGFQYVGGELNFFPHGEGYVNVTLGTTGNRIFNYVYYYTDHLGNIRLTYTKDMVSNQLKIMDETHYYPFGLKHQKYSPAGSLDLKAESADIARPGYVTSTPFMYRYNGKEFQDELGLNMYDMDMRQYDPAIARWVVLDPVIHHSMSPYNAFDNNPVFWADPSGADSAIFEQGGTSYSSITTATGVSISAGGAGDNNQKPQQSQTNKNTTSSSNASSSNSSGSADEGDPNAILLDEIVITDLNQLEEAIEDKVNDAMNIWRKWGTPTTPSWVGKTNDGVGGLGAGLSYNGNNGNRLFVGTARPNKPINLGISKIYGNGKTYAKPSYMGKTGSVVGKGNVAATVVLGSISVYDGIQQDGGTFGQNAAVATGGVVGGTAGAWSGAVLGAEVGAAVGVWFGGVGAAPGALIGGIVGGIAGGIIGTGAGENAVNAVY